MGADKDQGVVNVAADAEDSSKRQDGKITSHFKII